MTSGETFHTSSTFMHKWYSIPARVLKQSDFHAWICLISAQNLTSLSYQGVLTILEFDQVLLVSQIHPPMYSKAFTQSFPPLDPSVSMWAFVYTREWTILLLTHELPCVHSRLLWGRDWTRGVYPSGSQIRIFNLSHLPPLLLYKDVLGLSLWITESVHSICGRRNTLSIVSTLHQVLSASLPAARKGLVLCFRLVLWNQGKSGSLKTTKMFKAGSDYNIWKHARESNSLVVPWSKKALVNRKWICVKCWINRLARSGA